MSKVNAGDIVICNETVFFDDEDSFHYEGQLIEVTKGEEYYYNHPSNRHKYHLDKKNQNALRRLYNGKK